MNSKEQNRICVASLVEGFMAIVEDNGSKSAAKLARSVRNRGDAIIQASPRADSTKQINAMKRRIKSFDQTVLLSVEHTAITLTSALLAMVDTIIIQTNDNVPWIKLQRSLFSLHKYYDRKLNNYSDYRAGASMAYRWENFI